MTLIYSPNEDSYLLCETLDKLYLDKNTKILEVGIGSGYVLEFLKKKGFKNLTGTDINPEAVKLSKEKGFNVFESDLFSKVKDKYDLIIFNPPYLPEERNEDKDSKLATTGGKKGGEVINRFLKGAKSHLNRDGKIALLTSTLTKGIKWNGYNQTLLGEKKLFFEKLKVWEITL